MNTATAPFTLPGRLTIELMRLPPATDKWMLRHPALDHKPCHIDGARHEILMETDNIRAQFWAAFDVIADAAAPRAGAAAPAHQTGV